MRFSAILGVALVSVPMAASAGELAGVSDSETVIRSGEVREFQAGKGDVLFVRDRENKWYRVQVNEGCLKGSYDPQALVIEPRGLGNRIDKLSKVTVLDAVRYDCAIDSIRRSEAPPQVNSKSKVTLD